MNLVDRWRQSDRPLKITAGYLVLWLVCLLDLRTTQFTPPMLQLIVFAAAVPLLLYWLRKTFRDTHSPEQQKWIVATIGYVLIWQLTMFVFDWLTLDALRAAVARWGTVALFAIGLLWVVWYLERATNARAAGMVADPDNRDVWDPFDLRAWYYGVDWWQAKLKTVGFTFMITLCVATGGRLFKYLRARCVDQWPHGTRSHKLDQSFLALFSYSFTFLILALLFGQLSGCREIYEMPAGGGEQKQLAQVVKIKKVIRKKYVINPLSAIIFEVPPIDEVQLKLLEKTEHAYTVGFGEGQGAGFSEGTFRGKVRFIRLEYSGGDWEQDYGIGGDLNMLLEYGIRTQHKIAERTESRTISQLRNFPIGKSPPVVYMTGQQNISLSNSEVKTMREFLIEKHGMLFCDNGGSRHFHNQFLSMMNRVLPDVRPVPIPLDDIIHRVPYQIPYLPYVAPHGGKEALGWYQDGRWVAYYHPGDIGDAWADGHAGVKADIWESCYQLGTNVIFYGHAEYAKWLAARKKE